VQVDEALAYLRENSHAVLATLRSDGAPQLSPVAAGVDAEGRVVVSTRETAYKTRNLRRDPRAWICVFPDRFFGPWIQVEGRVEIVSLPDAMEPLVDYYRAVAGEHADWGDYRAAMEREQRVLVRLAPERVGPKRSG
jgi:PPOX class probable F420-dependent enzyme